MGASTGHAGRQLPDGDGASSQDWQPFFPQADKSQRRVGQRVERARAFATAIALQPAEHAMAVQPGPFAVWAAARFRAALFNDGKTIPQRGAARDPFAQHFGLLPRQFRQALQR